MQLNFGHWEIFKLLVLNLRELERTRIPTVKFQSEDQSDGSHSQQRESHPPPTTRKKSVVEKQVGI